MSRSIVIMVIAPMIIVSVLLATKPITVWAEFPRVSFLDPHSECDTLEQFNNYWSQMDSCGFTHNVGYGDELSFNNSANIFILDEKIDPVTRYAYGVQNEYFIGGGESDFKLTYPDSTAKNFQDGLRYVFLSLCDSNSAGEVFTDTLGDKWTQRFAGGYWFIFTMKMVGNTAGADTVAKIHVWETADSSDNGEGGLHNGLQRRYFAGAGNEKANTWLYLYSNDFDSSGVYENIALGPVNLEAVGCITEISFQWLGTRDLYIDHLWVRDSYNYNLFVSEDSDSFCTIIQDTLYNKSIINPQLLHCFYVDEPGTNMYHSFQKTDSLSRARTGFPINGATGNLPEENLNIFIDAINPDPTEIIYNYYTITCTTNTASSASLGDSRNLQYAWDRLINYERWEKAYCGMRTAITVCKDRGIPFWMTIQAHREESYNPGTRTWDCNLRAPTPNELSCEAYLALCYGAKGIVYYHYPSLRHYSTTGGYTGYGLVDLVECDSGDTIWTIDENSCYRRNDRWYAAQEINAKIDSLSDILENLTWRCAYLSKPDSLHKYAEIYPSFVDSLYSDDFGTDTSFVEIGEFQHNDGTYYLMLVNRRCLESESQTVTIWTKPGHDVYDSYFIQDMYNQDVYGGNNGIFSEILLAPGEGRLFKLVDSDATWSGTVNVQSSVTVPQGVILTVEPSAEIKFSQNTKLQIDGVLQAKGSPDDSIHFTAIDTTKNWSSILFTNPSVDSLCILKNCLIEYAATGVWCNGASPDTIANVSIRQCEHGIRCEDGSSPQIFSPMMNDGTVACGISCSEQSNPFIKSPLLSGNGASYSKGIKINNSRPEIQGGTISAFARGIDICGGDPEIRDVELNNNTECGIACNLYADIPPPGDASCASCSAFVAYNVITDNKYGIKSKSASPIVFHNKILENDSSGVWCTGSSVPFLGADTSPDSGYNEIYNDSLDVYSECSDTIKAERNWWGQYPPDTTKIVGLVDYEPYLIQPPDSSLPERVTDLTASLSKNNIVLQWSAVTTDLKGGPISIDHYTMYRNTTVGFVPVPSDSIGAVKENSYVDSGIVSNPGPFHFYVVRASDKNNNMSYDSNMVGEFGGYIDNDTKDPYEDSPWE